MCFTCGTSSSNDRSGSDDAPTDEHAASLLRPTEIARNRSQRSRRTRLSSFDSSDNQEDLPKVDARNRKPKTKSWNPFKRKGKKEPSPDDDAICGSEAVTEEFTPRELPSDEQVLHFDLSPISFEESPKREESPRVYISVEFDPKMKTKQVKGMITGMGKELRRAATTVSQKIPNSTKKKSKAEKERQELMRAEPLVPQARNPDEIKKAYGYGTDTRNAAGMAQNKLRERGEKLSSMQRRTAELEADAANFSKLADELAKKMDSRKW